MLSRTIHSVNLSIVDLSSGSDGGRATLKSTLSNSSAGSSAIYTASSATARNNSRTRQIRVSSSRAPDAEVDSLVLDLVDTGDLDTLGSRVAFASLNLDLSAGVVEFGLSVVGTVDGDVFAADEVFAVGLWRHDTLAFSSTRIVTRQVKDLQCCQGQ